MLLKVLFVTEVEFLKVWVSFSSHQMMMLGMAAYPYNLKALGMTLKNLPF